MKKFLLIFLVGLLGFFAISCKKDADQGGLSGSWILSEIVVNLDENEIARIPVSGFETTFSASSFTYIEGVEKSGGWSINVEETELTVDYESVSSNFPIISKTDNQITFTIKTIDLNQSAFSEEDQQLFLIANQTLFESGSSWSQATTNGKSVRVDFILTRN